MTVVEYEAAMRGIQLKIIDQYEMMAKTAMANRYAHHAKSAKEHKIFDKNKALKSIQGSGQQRKPNRKMLQQANQALKNYQVKFNVENKVEKGGRV
ncbi:hypothetical protein [Carnobacterium gallinarum]